jgi:hypothetical protein
LEILRSFDYAPFDRLRASRTSLLRMTAMVIVRVQPPYRQLSIFAYPLLPGMGSYVFGYCGKEMLNVFFTHCLSVPLIGLGYIKAAAVKTMASSTTSFKSLI